MKMDISSAKSGKFTINFLTAAFSVLLFFLSFFNVSGDHLADIDFDTAHAVYGLMFDEPSLSVHPAILHPAVKFIYIPFTILYKSGVHPLAALQIHYSIYITASALLFGMLCFRLTKNIPFSFLMFGSFCYFPAVQTVIQTMDDNLYAYPFLFSGIMLAFSTEKLSALSIYFRFVCVVILYSMMIFVCMTLFPFVFFISFLFMINIFSDTERRDSFKLLFAMILTGLSISAAAYFLFSIYHGLSGKALLDETLGWSGRFSSDISAAVGNYSRMDFLKASLWNGLFSIPRSETVISQLGFMLSFIYGKSKSAYLVYYLFLYYLFVVQISFSYWKAGSVRNCLHSVNLLLLMGAGLGFIFWFQDISFHERWDFFYLALPWAAYIVFGMENRKYIIILSLFIAVPLFFGFKIFYNARDNFSDYRAVKNADKGYQLYMFTQDEIPNPIKTMICVLKDYYPIAVVKTRDIPEKEKMFRPFFLIDREAADEKIKSMKNSEIFISKDAEKLLKK